MFWRINTQLKRGLFLGAQLFAIFGIALIALPDILTAETIPPETSTTEELFRAPITKPHAFIETNANPDFGIFFGAGFHRYLIEGRSSHFESKAMPNFSDGGDILLTVQWSSVRLEFIHKTLRRPPVAGLEALDGEQLSQFGFDADQIWLNHGFHPWHNFRFGYGVGYQRRVVILQKVVGEQEKHREQGAVGGLMIDYAFASPFVLHMRQTWEQPTEYLAVSGQSVFIAYIVPF